jgi:hypothetical protein
MNEQTANATLLGETVRLTAPASGMPAGAEGRLIGWYAVEDLQALVVFEGHGALRVPDEAVEVVGKAA